MCRWLTFAYTINSGTFDGVVKVGARAKKKIESASVKSASLKENISPGPL